MKNWVNNITLDEKGLSWIKHLSKKEIQKIVAEKFEYFSSLIKYSKTSWLTMKPYEIRDWEEWTFACWLWEEWDKYFNLYMEWKIKFSDIPEEYFEPKYLYYWLPWLISKDNDVLWPIVDHELEHAESSDYWDMLMNSREAVLHNLPVTAVGMFFNAFEDIYMGKKQIARGRAKKLGVQNLYKDMFTTTGTVIAKWKLSKLDQFANKAIHYWLSKEFPFTFDVKYVVDDDVEEEFNQFIEHLDEIVDVSIDNKERLKKKNEILWPIIERLWAKDMNRLQRERIKKQIQQERQQQQEQQVQQTQENTQEELSDALNQQWNNPSKNEEMKDVQDSTQENLEKALNNNWDNKWDKKTEWNWDNSAEWNSDLEWEHEEKKEENNNQWNWGEWNNWEGNWENKNNQEQQNEWWEWNNSSENWNNWEQQENQNNWWEWNNDSEKWESQSQWWNMDWNNWWEQNENQNSSQKNSESGNQWENPWEWENPSQSSWNSWKSWEWEQPANQSSEMWGNQGTPSQQPSSMEQQNSQSTPNWWNNIPSQNAAHQNNASRWSAQSAQWWKTQEWMTETDWSGINDPQLEKEIEDRLQSMSDEEKQQLMEEIKNSIDEKNLKEHWEDLKMQKKLLDKKEQSEDSWEDKNSWESQEQWEESSKDKIKEWKKSAEEEQKEKLKQKEREKEMEEMQKQWEEIEKAVDERNEDLENEKKMEEYLDKLEEMTHDKDMRKMEAVEKEYKHLLEESEKIESEDIKKRLKEKIESMKDYLKKKENDYEKELKKCWFSREEEYLYKRYMKLEKELDKDVQRFIKKLEDEIPKLKEYHLEWWYTSWRVTDMNEAWRKIRLKQRWEKLYSRLEEKESLEINLWICLSVDVSGSMCDNIWDTMKLVIFLGLLCQKWGIPFHVNTFWESLNIIKDTDDDFNERKWTLMRELVANDWWTNIWLSVNKDLEVIKEVKDTHPDTVFLPIFVTDWEANHWIVWQELIELMKNFKGLSTIVGIWINEDSLKYWYPNSKVIWLDHAWEIMTTLLKELRQFFRKHKAQIFKVVTE